MVAPHPVGQVQGAVQPQEEQVVGGDGLRLARVGDHEQLGHDGHRLQEDGERPQDLESRDEEGGWLRVVGSEPKGSGVDS